jgi:hypothetical protein
LQSYASAFKQEEGLMAKLSLDFEKVWRRHVSLYSDLFVCSLLMLSQCERLTGNEDNVSIILWGCLERTCKRYAREKNQEIACPKFQVPVQSVSMAKKTSANALKKPDFTCFKYNPLTASEVALHIECKLLGKPKPSSPSWKFNKNYVTEGIKRFDLHTHQYGINATCGMMIGYIIGMTPQEIESEVNDYQKKHASEYTAIKFFFDTTTLFKTRQDIKRKNVLPARFELIHLWVDLRNCYKDFE